MSHFPAPLWSLVGLVITLDCCATSAAAAEPEPSPARPAEKAHSPAQTEAGDFELPPVPVDKMSAESPQPSWDTGLLLGVCGIGNEKVWRVTKFCLGGLVEVMFLRQEEDELGLGGYLEMSTAGFRDVRTSGGLTSIVSLIDWFSLSVRGGGLAVMSSDGVQPGLEGYLGLGHRSVSLSSHYGLSHSLFGGMQYGLPSGGLPASHAIWAGLRVDGVWLTAPVALFR